MSQKAPGPAGFGRAALLLWPFPLPLNDLVVSKELFCRYLRSESMQIENSRVELSIRRVTDRGVLGVASYGSQFEKRVVSSEGGSRYR